MSPRDDEPNEADRDSVLLRGGRYLLLGKLGEGSQGETYEAVDNGAGSALREKNLVDEWARYVRGARSGPRAGTAGPSGRRVAIKCFRVGQAKAWKDVELAEREANTLASLHHARLPKYVEHFEEEGALYLVMEKIEGESLAKLRAGPGRRPWSAAEVTKLLEDAADALRYLHGQSPLIVHRDIKPGNILRRPDGSYAIVDFGSVRDRLKPTGGSTVVGTFGYMAPEQFQGRASPKSDVYGVGATAIAMLTGREPEELPHEGLGIAVDRAVPQGTPPGLTRALAAMLTPDPDERVASVDEALALAREGPARSVRHADDAARGKNRRRRREEKRDERRARKRDKSHERAERRARKVVRRSQRPRVPLLPRIVARLGLLVALVVVWIAAGLVTPLALIVLSLLFGGALRRAAAACVRSARRSQAALGRASAWLSGRPAEDAPRVRVSSDAEGEPQARVRATADDGERLDEWMDERLTSDPRMAELRDSREQQMRLHARPPATSADPKRRFRGR